ncbi:DNA polymerase I [bacterium]|nr:DNA polymerase I [bacterium]
MSFLFLDEYKPEYCAICFDRKEPTFRHLLYTEYKGHRPPAPVDFVSQMPILDQLIDRVGMTRLSLAGYEADDLLGTLADKANAHGIDALIMTGDRDAFQLVGPHTTVLMNKKGVSELDHFTPDAIREKYGLEPAQLIDLKAFQGDSSDNIPGVPGIGEKTALNLMTAFGSMDAVYRRLDDVTPERIKQKLIDGRDLAMMSRKLAEIDRHVPIKVNVEDLVCKLDWVGTIQCFNEFGFKTLVQKYGRRVEGEASVDTTSVEIERPKGHYRCVMPDEIESILPELKSGFAVDLETTSLNIRDAQIVGIALSWKVDQAVYIPLNRYVKIPKLQVGLFETEESEELHQHSRVIELLKPILEDPKIPKITHNGKYEISVFRNYGVRLAGIVSDTMVSGFLTNPLQKVGLKEMAQAYLGITMQTYPELVGTGKQAKELTEVACEAVAQYAGADADMTLRLSDTLDSDVKAGPAGRLYQEIELPILEVLADMEYTGVAIDTAYLRHLHGDYSAWLKEAESDIFKAAGTTFNISSTKQLAEVLYDQLGLPVLKKTKTGRSTDSEVLEELQHNYPIAALLLRYRKLEKLLNTYVDSLPKLVNPRTNRVHTSFNPTGAVTGRLSSTNPNLQNIPIRDPEGMAIRGAFVPSTHEGVIISADYSQIELRLMAHLSEDPAMIEAFNRHEDIHRSTAARIFNVPLSEVTKEQRYKAKAVNFGIIYGISAFGLSQNIGVSRAEAKAIIDGYFDAFPGVKRFMESTIEAARTEMSVRTEYGRVRPLPEINDRNPGRRQFAERSPK